ncbi:competence type IV pilus major pilin ComGC [Bacillus sp. 1NLA3E]|uniref:competence type IV pilus major pilin ComGC n=1 Tax=Bacillus sp. 1NLA3E TaxID=666686 RepID=UPI000247E6F5|nr:competence type IV pilus major pilin ComGC [Bacillus sp. 1NLA3E]AGK54883.1 ComG operon protein 3 [Bacillus sp. 1NLA3E]
MKNEKGFTLIEMMIVLLIISVLLIITIPNVAKHNANINTKGCQAYVKMVEAQVQAYHLDLQKYPASTQELIDEGYLKSGETACPDSTNIVIGADGEVTTTTSGS